MTFLFTTHISLYISTNSVAFKAFKLFNNITAPIDLFDIIYCEDEEEGSCGVDEEG